ncbi:alpha/beta hydrolase family protein [Actinoplanes regularis]|uniref:Platelet-activating factor acetylhydrolase, isoform II n=1 Tax=Actinoplanes regularis TaxID=52697 RepID=A0A239BYY8_9ACTN|nr:acetylhydrolase [Actinoplanes regularis]GIE88202.1 lipase [Actinoplanes regularis]SNS13116.1 Platelet-activating factor acetylhydrolase, isoform II [Actinoplanes regularis]
MIEINELTRRRLLAAALAAGVAVPLGAAGRGSPARAASGPARLTLPPPTGPHPVGTVSLHLIDESRPDPVAGPGHHRELMAGVWYPATRDARRHQVAPWMAAAPLRALLGSAGFDPDAVAAPLTAGHEGAAVLRAPGRLPVIVYSHGAGGYRSETTIVVQELASHGYVVVTVDHTDDAFVEFPDGRLAVPADAPFTPWDSAYDIRFVLDRIEDLAAGRNPDAERRRLPAGLGAALDPHRIGMFGWSKGATSTALVMNQDRRVRAGLGFDGPMQSRPAATDLDRPFMLMTADFTRAAEPSVAQFWDHLRGWRLDVHADGAVHGAYCDLQWLMPQLASIVGMSDEDLAGWIGTLDPVRAVRIQQTYPLAFFDLHLRHRRQRLLEGPNPAFPEVRFIP